MMGKYFEKGIDVSHWQGEIDFNEVRSAGYSFVIIKAGGADGRNNSKYKDVKYETYYKQAKLAGLKVGAYYYTSKDFFTDAKALDEARHFLTLLEGKEFEYPVAVDIEEVSDCAGISNITSAALTFLKEVESAGYYISVYASDVSGFQGLLNPKKLEAYDKWVARYNATGSKVIKNPGIWQYGGSVNYINSVKVPGVSSNACDQNYSYKDYASIIRGAGLNNLTKPQTQTQTPQPQTQTPQTTQTRYMATGDVYLREGPGVNNKALKVIKKGMVCIGVGPKKTVDGRVWIKVSLNGLTGWASSKYLEG